MFGSVKKIQWSVLAGLAGLLLAAGNARAATNPTSCTNDIDCVATPSCGGDVCDWNHAPMRTCKPAGGDAQGMDGWCAVDSDCKCMGQGAVCHCALLHEDRRAAARGPGRFDRLGRFDR